MSPTWSPDGQQIAFLSNRAEGWDLYTMPAGGGEADPNDQRRDGRRSRLVAQRPLDRYRAQPPDRGRQPRQPRAHGARKQR